MCVYICVYIYVYICIYIYIYICNILRKRALATGFGLAGLLIRVARCMVWGSGYSSRLWASGFRVAAVCLGFCSFLLFKKLWLVHASAKGSVLSRILLNAAVHGLYCGDS